jgi:hypothetical protein
MLALNDARFAAQYGHSPDPKRRIRRERATPDPKRIIGRPNVRAAYAG